MEDSHPLYMLEERSINDLVAYRHDNDTPGQ